MGMSAIRTAVVACALAALAPAGCARPSDPAPPAPTVVLPAPSTVTYEPEPSPSPAPSTPAGSSWVMPDLVGADLQAAQDAIQTLTDFTIAITTSHDATGAGRAQVLDRNWTVCAQNIPAGTTITARTVIDFAAVKSGERC